MRRPIDRPCRITGDRATHASYAGPANDYALPPGAAIVAPFDATLSQWYSRTGGETLVFRRSDGATVSVQHIHNLASGTIREGEPAALVDGWDDDHGTAWDGPHAHVWVTLADGTRLSFEEFIAHEGGEPAALHSIAQPTIAGLAGTTEEIDMPLNKDDELAIRRVVADLNADHVANVKAARRVFRDVMGREPEQDAAEFWAWKLAPRGEEWLRKELAAIKAQGGR